MTEKEIVKKLIGTYPNSIVAMPVYQDRVGVDFVETVDNLSKDIMRDFDAGRQKYYFGVTFNNQQECSKYIAGYLHTLFEACEDFVENTYGVDTDGELYYLRVENDE